VPTLGHEIVHPSRADEYCIYYITDTHIGARATDESLLRKHIKRIERDPHALWICGGDMLDAINRNDPRHQESALATWLHGVDDILGAQKRHWVDMFKPIAHKCLAILSGNHETSVLKHSERDIYDELCTEVANASGINPGEIKLGYGGFLQLVFLRRGKGKGNRYALNFYVHHGYGGGRKAGGHALALEDIMLTYDADIYLMGHRHVRQTVESLRIGPDIARGHAQRKRVGIFSGSYLNSLLEVDGQVIDTYALRKGLRPQPLGCTYIEVRPDKKFFNIVLLGEND
jgi:hypothetical protein